MGILRPYVKAKERQIHRPLFCHFFVPENKHGRQKFGMEGQSKIDGPWPNPPANNAIPSKSICIIFFSGQGFATGPHFGRRRLYVLRHQSSQAAAQPV